MEPLYAPGAFATASRRFLAFLVPVVLVGAGLALAGFVGPAIALPLIMMGVCWPTPTSEDRASAMRGELLDADEFFERADALYANEDLDGLRDLIGDDLFEVGSDHPCCPNCGHCLTCGDMPDDEEAAPVVAEPVTEPVPPVAPVAPTPAPEESDAQLRMGLTVGVTPEALRKAEPSPLSHDEGAEC